jgi:ligand-binding sensor domain-containing protein
LGRCFFSQPALAATQKNEMTRLIKNIFITILASTVISCYGQVKKEKQSLQAEKGSEMVKIPVPENGFSNAYLDKDGTIWFSSNGGGIFHYDGKAFKNYTEKNGLSSNQVYSITSDHKNNMWFGTQNGLTKYDRKQFENIPLPYQDTTTGWISSVYPTLSPNAAHSLATDNNNNLWIGTAGGGAYKYDGENFKSYLTEIGKKQEDSLYHNWIPFIRKDKKGNLWFASMTHGGVSQFDGKEFTQFLIKDGLSEDQVRTIYCDKTGKILFGFNGNRNSGLTFYDGNSFKTYSVEDGLCNKRIRAIYEDKNGNLWLGAGMGNLCIFDGQQFFEFNYKGQTFSDILFIFADLEDNIWFGGVNGIWKFDGESVIKMTI